MPHPGVPEAADTVLMWFIFIIQWSFDRLGGGVQENGVTVKDLFVFSLCLDKCSHQDSPLCIP